MISLFSRGVLTLFITSALTVAQVIVPGATWTDTSGNVIQAHGGGILKVGSTYYWFGEDKSANSALFKAVSCYSSTDLVSWARQNDALTPINGTMISASDIVERPKVLYNAKNSEYVMWFHSDTSNYGAAMVGVATANSPCGPYTYKSSWQPLGKESRDMGLFQDDDTAQTSYLLYASDNNQNFKITQLDADYYNVTTQVNVLTGATLEAPGIVKRDGVYYLFASHTSGWDPNPNKFFSSPSLSGNWSSQADIAPSNTRTWFSQNNYDLPLGSNAIYMGDRWRPSLLGSSRYIWYPLDWSSGSPQIVHADVWKVNLGAGTYSTVNGTSYEAENGTLGGAAVLFSDPSFSGGGAVGYLGNGGTVTLNNVQGTGAAQWVALYYANGDSSWRNTTVSVNSGSSVVVDQPNTGGTHVIISVPVKLTLRPGSNSITFGSAGTNYAADLDRIVVYPN
ncbi:glycoside hydrolase family 43 protein, partial [Heterobasidion irregulare TC 32-1]